ncbi:MAG: hypothetical protein Q7S96_01130 [bacterium]|nr:hypothetical protein [bacterium]
MPKDPTLLPEDMRKAEEDVQRASGARGNTRGVFHVPSDDEAVRRTRPPVRKRPEAKRESTPAPALPPVAVPSTPPPAANPPVRRAPRAVPVAGEGERLHIPALGRRALRSISLIPSELKKKPVSPTWPRLIAVVGIALTIPLVGIPWAMLSSRVTREQEETRVVEARRSDVLSRIAAMERAVESYRVTADRAIALQAIVEQHGTWKPFFDLLEARTLPGMRYDQLSVDANGTITLPTIAPNLRVAAAQLVAWQEEPRVEDLGISGFSSVIDELGITRGIRFDLRLRVRPDLFTMFDDTGSAIVPASVPAS